jgi:hypothetical protein
MAKIDLKRIYRDHYSAKPEPTVVEVPARPFLMIDGSGDPNTAVAYRNAVLALYPLAYAIRRELADRTGDVYTVMPLEGLWWVEDMADFDVADKGNWEWTAMICQPDVVTADLLADIAPTVIEKKKLESGHLVRLDEYGEGRAAQVLHRGPYSAEAPTIELLHRFIEEAGYLRRGLHHEIYLSDPRKVEPANVRTIIRQPIE